MVLVTTWNTMMVKHGARLTEAMAVERHTAYPHSTGGAVQILTRMDGPIQPMIGKPIRTV